MSETKQQEMYNKYMGILDDHVEGMQENLQSMINNSDDYTLVAKALKDGMRDDTSLLAIALLDLINNKEESLMDKDNIIAEQQKEIEELKSKLNKGHKVKAGEKIATHKKATPEACKKLRDEGYSIEAVAKKLDCSIMTVRRKLGLTTNGLKGDE